MTPLVAPVLRHRLGNWGAVASTSSISASATATSPSTGDFVDHFVRRRHPLAAVISSSAAFHSGWAPRCIVPQRHTGRIRCTENQSLYRFHNQQQQQRRRNFAHQTTQHDETETNNSQNKMTMTLSPQEMTSLQNQLLHEASYLTRTLYRKCLQSINLLALGNTRDEDDFSARETHEKNQFDDTTVNLSNRISMAPPVNRTNELSSRANYYASYARENFDGHWNLLGAHGFHIGEEGNMTHGLGGSVHFGGGVDDSSGGNNQQERNRYQGGHHHLGGQMVAQQYRGSEGENGDGGSSSRKQQQQQQQQGDVQHYLWREEQIEQFIYLIKSGEEKRQWILNDYEFEDPFNSPKRSDDDDDDDDDGSARCRGWSHELEHRLKKFEEQSNLLVKAMYRGKGWMHSSDYEHLAKEDEGFFSDGDSDDDL